MNEAIKPIALADPGYSAGTIERPAYLLCPPFSHSAGIPNNAWMTELPEKARQIDRRRSLVQFLELYHFLASDALVYLLPTPANSGLQDQVFTANLGFVPEHLAGREVAVISNFTTKPRVGEAPYGEHFFQEMGYRTVTPPYHFEGEAEIKHLHDNIYIGGYGVRSDRKVHDWLAETLGMTIVSIRECDPHLYHLDCTVFPITREETLVCTSMLTRKEVKQIERVTNIIDVTEDAAFSGIANSIRFHNMILNASNIHDLHAGEDDYRLELAKNRLLEDICADRGFEPVFFNLSEYMKSGALLSCMVLHLNRHSYEFRLV